MSPLGFFLLIFVAGPITLWITGGSTATKWVAAIVFAIGLVLLGIFAFFLMAIANTCSAPGANC